MTLPRHTRPSRAANCAPSLVCNTVRVTRNHAAIETTARIVCGHCPPSGSWFCAHAADLRSAGCALSSVCNTAATHAILLRLTHKRGLGAATRRHPFLSRKGCKSDPRGHPLDIPLMRLAAFPAVWAAPTGAGQRAHGLAKTTAAGYANRSLSAPIRDTLQRQLAPGCSKTSSAAAETAHAPAEGMTRPRVLFAALPRLTRFCYPLRHSAIWPRRLAAPSGGQNAPMA